MNVFMSTRVQALTTSIGSIVLGESNRPSVLGTERNVLDRMFPSASVLSVAYWEKGRWMLERRTLEGRKFRGAVIEETRVRSSATTSVDQRSDRGDEALGTFGVSLILIHPRPRIHDPLLLIVLLLLLWRGRGLRLLFREHFVDRVSLRTLDDAFQQVLGQDWVSASGCGTTKLGE